MRRLADKAAGLPPKSRFRLLMLVLVPILAIAVFGQNKQTPAEWESKPISDWNAKDINDILQNSPWSRTLQGMTVDNLSIGTIAGGSSATFTLQSALTVRLATIRKHQLAEKYDSMSPKDQATFNTKYRASLECSLCEKYYIVAITGFSQMFQNAGRIERRASSIYLANEKGEKRTLAKYSPSITYESPALFFFARNNDKGEALLNADNTTLIFNFRYEQDDEAVIRLVERVEIKVRDIVRDKVVIF